MLAARRAFLRANLSSISFNRPFFLRLDRLCGMEDHCPKKPASAVAVDPNGPAVTGFGTGPRD